MGKTLIGTVELKAWLDYVYEVTPECGAKTFNQDMASRCTSEVLSSIFKRSITEEQIEEIRKLYLEKYKDEKLYAYCCGELIPTPYYYSDVTSRLTADVLGIVEEK